MKVLLVCDRANWAYDAIARALVKHNPDRDLELDVLHLKGDTDRLRAVWRDYDGTFVLGWQLLGQLGWRVKQLLDFLEPNSTITGIHSHHSFDGRRTQPDHGVPPPRKLVRFLARYRGVNAVSRRLAELFRDAGLEKVAYTPNGVDIELFRPRREVGTDETLRVGFSGSKKHDWRKGISEVIEPAAGLPGVELRLAMPAEGSYVPLEEMPAFYNELDVYVCASSSEGFSLSVLEAAASGRPIVSTRVGGSEDLIEDGVNGFLVDRDVAAIREKLELLAANRDLARAMGAANRRIVEERWSWQARTPAWTTFIRRSLEQA